MRWRRRSRDCRRRWINTSTSSGSAGNWRPWRRRGTKDVMRAMTADTREALKGYAFISPSIVPAVAAAMIWLWLFNPKLGLVNFALNLIGVKEPPGWLGSEQWAMPALVFISVWGAGNTVVIYLAGLQDVPKDLYEAAKLDG